MNDPKHPVDALADEIDRMWDQLDCRVMPLAPGKYFDKGLECN